MAKQQPPQIDISKISPAVAQLNKSILQNNRAQNLQQIADNLAQIKALQDKKKIKDEFVKKVRQGVAVKAVGNRPRPEGYDPVEWNGLSPEEQDDYLYRTEQRDILTVTRQQARDVWQGALKSAKGIVGRASGRIADVPTPGEVWFPVIILLVLNLFLIPIKGADGTILTRFSWFWQALTGNAWLDSDSAITRTTQKLSSNSQGSTVNLSTNVTNNQTNQYATTQFAFTPQLANYQDLHLALSNQGLTDPTQVQPATLPTETYGERMNRLQGAY